MAKKAKRRLKKQVRKTLGALFLASAIGVAAIPTGSYNAGQVQAEGTVDASYITNMPVNPSKFQYMMDIYNQSKEYDSTRNGVTYHNLKNNTKNPDEWPDSCIPTVDVGANIYTTGDGVIQFAYVDSSGQTDGAGNKYAIILGYNPGGALEGGVLEIPNAIDAYVQFSDSTSASSGRGYVAVNRIGKFLYYHPYEERLDVSGNTEIVYTDELVPCYYSTYDIWSNKDYYKNTDFYYYTTEDGKYAEGATLYQSVSEDVQRLEGAVVAWIGNQHLTSERINGGEDAGWKIDTSENDWGYITRPSQGVFYAKGNISTLIIGKDISGIGDYAFYGCTSMDSIQIGNGIVSIGNYAFGGCSSLRSITWDNDGRNNLTAIGAGAFMNCQQLMNFRLPISVQTLCDGAFYGCVSLAECDLTNGWDTTDSGSYPSTNAATGSLSKMGRFPFYNCMELHHLFFPDNFGQKVEISALYGCDSIEHVISKNLSFDFVDSSTTGDFTLQDFLAGVTEKFYFEGLDRGKLHETCTEEAISFKYYKENLYERTVYDDVDTNGNPAGNYITLQVNNQNQLTKAVIEGPIETLVFPDWIGPYYISIIGSGVFQNICSLKELSIPETVSEIKSNAFRGCHNLEYVRFGNDQVIIGTDAFKTQDCTEHMSTCTTRSDGNRHWYSRNDMTSNNLPSIQLHFIGDISAESTPYNYAMSPTGNYNNGSQAYSFIQYLSGFPTCLTVEYNYNSSTNTGYAELVDFPSYSTMSDYYSCDYFTESEKAAARGAASAVAAGNPTEDQETFYNVTKLLTIPTGIDSIKDGLFYSKTENNPHYAMDVVAYGIKTIETELASSSSDNFTAAVVDPSKSDFAGCKALKSIQLLGEETKTLEDYAFADCDYLTSVYATAPIDVIGERAFSDDTVLSNAQFYGAVGEIDYRAFENCTALENVMIHPGIGKIEDAPFYNCSRLADVDFQDSPKFDCINSIIFELDGSGEPKAVVELLAGRTSGNAVAASELSGVDSLYDEAFAGTPIVEVDMSETGFGKLSDYAFMNTTGLYSVTLPDSCTTIGNYSFLNSSLRRITGSGNLVFVTEDEGMFGLTATGYNPATGTGSHTSNQNVTIYAPEGSYFRAYAATYGYDGQDVPKYFTVYFHDYTADSSIMQSIVSYQSVLQGEAATLPAEYGVVGSKFLGWYDANGNPDAYKSITEDTHLYAVYEAQFFDVSFYTYDGLELIETISVGYGTDAEKVAPAAPEREGYLFAGWDRDISEVTKDIETHAMYTATVVDSWTVNYYYDDGTTLYLSFQVKPGDDAPNPEGPKKEGYTFKGWNKTLTNVTTDIDTVAEYTKNEVGPWTVTYYNYDGTQFYQTTVEDGADAPNIAGPTREGYDFGGWDRTLTQIHANTDTVAVFTLKPRPNPDPEATPIYTVSYYSQDGNTLVYTTQVEEGKDAPNIVGPAIEGMTFTGWDRPLTAVKESFSTRAQYVASAAGYYHLTVVNGTGSGAYKAGTTVIIVANDPKSGLEFSSWTVESNNVTLPSTKNSATTVTMPKADVVVTANYVAKTSGSGSGTGSSTGTKPNGKKSGNTTVVIDKSGLSNTSVTSATVNGSTDNFTIKITESAAASEAVLKALMEEYGEDISNIAYFPMDISLYDATGTKKISDTSGLTITITIPIPDTLRDYAGNNKVAAVIDGRLSSLAPKFTTIDSVPCVTFTATHFSPYVIYVNKVKLTAGGEIDTTPKTGDGIHPKWFLSIGLLAISILLFLKKDKVMKPKPQTVRASR